MLKILKVEFPFLERGGSKPRPVLQLSAPVGRYQIMVVAYVTSRVASLLESDVELEASEGTGLTKDSVVRLHKLHSIPASKVWGEVGNLSDGETKRVKRNLRKVLGL